MDSTPFLERFLCAGRAKACSEGRPLAGLVLRELSEGAREGEPRLMVLGRMTPLEPDELWVEPFPVPRVLADLA